MGDAARLDEATLADYLRRSGLVARGEPVVVEPAGDGNINWVRRARSGGRSWVVKQARPSLERFPEYSAPTERILFEAAWLETARRFDAEGVCPRVVHFDPEWRVLVFEDLGAAPRLDHLLAGGADGVPAARRLARFLGAVHAGTRDPSLAARFRNDAMRRLHGDHIFALPFRPNDFPLAPALRARAEALWRDDELVAIADAAYHRYLEPRGALVHGDVQAGNVLVGHRGAVLLDAEIAHVGDPAFDLGTLLAHLWLPSVALGRSEAAEPIADAVLAAYAGASDAAPSLRAAAERYASIEMLRRTLGAARVAVVEEPERGLAVVDFAARRLRRGTDVG
jgi:5-methylthioribose kinase